MVTTDGTLSWGFGNSSNSATGFFVNRTEVQTYFGKCAYAHDGGTDYRFNFGCGCNDEGSPRCDSKAAAYYSLDPETNFETNLTDKSPLVGGCTVEKLDAGQGFWPGPAYYRPTGFPKKDEMFGMLQYRASMADKMPWNEMVLDAEAMIERLEVDPASVVPAIVYVPSVSAKAKATAKTMAAEFASKWNLESPIPVIKIDATMVVTNGKGDLFQYEEDSDTIQV